MTEDPSTRKENLDAVAQAINRVAHAEPESAQVRELVQALNRLLDVELELKEIRAPEVSPLSRLHSIGVESTAALDEFEQSVKALRNFVAHGEPGVISSASIGPISTGGTVSNVSGDIVAGSAGYMEVKKFDATE